MIINLILSFLLFFGLIGTDSSISINIGDGKNLGGGLILDINEYYIRNEDGIDVSSKIWVKFSVLEEDQPSYQTLTLVRLDNVEQMGNKAMDYYYEDMLDTLWRDVRGWKGDLVLVIFDANHKERQIIIPSNEAFDSMQIRIEGLLLKGIEPKNMEIPRIIHQAGGDHKNDMLMVIKKSMTLLRINNPSYEHRVTSIEEMASYIGEREGERGLRAFMTLKPIAFKVDLFRLVALYHHGGVYLDSKLITISPLDAILPEKGGSVITGKLDAHFQSAFLGMPKGDILMRRSIDKLIYNVERKSYGRNCLDITGPSMVYSTFDKELTEIEKERYCMKMKFQKDGNFIISEDNVRLIHYHNAEYRRMMTFSQTSSYGTLYKNKDIFN